MKAKKILLIDDERDFGILMKSYFIPKNIEVYHAVTLEEGMRILDEVHPDVIFLDNNLPDGLGWGKTEYILVNHPGAQLNLISAYHVPKTSASTFRILEKPLVMDEINKIFE
jgi:DNA-binding response OmpR family regulator